MTERRYSEDEVAAIFERAAEAQQSTRRPLAPGEGMTLADLQEIGRDVGIHPALVADAARSLQSGGRRDARMLLGLPIGVGRTVDLGRPLSDAEWERLVVDLRETFDARGTVRAQGNLRQWTNGNLQVLVEPTAAGHQVRMQTINGRSRAYMMSGLGVMGGSLAALAAVAIGSGLADGAIGGVTFLGLMGAGMFGIGALRLPRWSRLRRRQMDGVAARLTLPPGALPAGATDPR